MAHFEQNYSHLYHDKYDNLDLEYTKGFSGFGNASISMFILITGCSTIDIATSKNINLCIGYQIKGINSNFSIIFCSSTDFCEIYTVCVKLKKEHILFVKLFLFS